MSGCFELKCAPSSNGHNEFYFNFLDSKGETILISSEYQNKEDAEKAINEVRSGSLMSDQVAAGKVASGDLFFVIKNRAGEVLVKSILYNSRMVFDNALHAVKDSACIASINDLS